MHSLQPGETLLHYEVVEKIGEGGMGEVFKAVDSKLGRPVAIKTLPADAGQDRTARQRLLREARAASALNHPGIVTIYAIETADDFDFIVMEYLSGTSVSERISDGPLAVSELLTLGIHVADALAAAHAAGIVHRDVKPANVVIVPSGQCKLLDFSLAKPAPAEAYQQDTMRGLTEAGVRVGTIAYMSPEQTRGEPLDGRSDTFSLGCVLYEAATGKRAFDGPSALSIMHNIAATDPPPPSTLSLELPAEFDLLIQRALAKDRERRYAAPELAEALRALKRPVADPGGGLSVAEATQAEVQPRDILGRERTRPAATDPLQEIAGESRAIVALRKQLSGLLTRPGGAARRLPPILIQGETGTGKGLVAAVIHKAGPRAGGPFVDLNCAAIPEALFEAELFGSERGALTDTRHAKAGLLQTADRGTLFLDDIGLMPKGSQGKLLKVIEGRTVRRLGSAHSEPVDIWFVAATSEDLKTAVQSREFRTDLYHRLAVVTLELPPLRDRGGDILILAEQFLEGACTDYGVPQKTLAPDARTALMRSRWPGNIRELSNVMERVALLSNAATVTAGDLGLPIEPAPSTQRTSAADPPPTDEMVAIKKHALTAERDATTKHATRVPVESVLSSANRLASSSQVVGWVPRRLTLFASSVTTPSGEPSATYVNP